MAGHYLETDADKQHEKALAKHEREYGNVLTDYVRLLIAEVKSRGPINLAEAVRQQRESQAKWQRRREERAAQDAANEAVADLPLFAPVGGTGDEPSPHDL